MTISDDALAAAVESGVITADQAVRLRALETARQSGGAEPEDDEKLRFISGFGDVFVTIGVLLFLGAGAYFVFQLGGAIPMWAGVAAGAWALAEYFTGRRRMALPSIVLLAAFEIGVGIAAYLGLAHLLGAPAFDNPFGINPTPDAETQAQMASQMRLSSLAIAGAGVIAALAAFVHYRRFRVPITVAAGAGALAATAMSILSSIAPDFTTAWSRPIVFVLGCAVFALAMRYDLSDPERVTRRTDIAFWLHLLAAPMIVHSLVAGMFGDSESPSGLVAVGIIAMFLALGVVAVLIDRRALLVSGLSYAGIAFGSLLQNTGLTDAIVPLTLLVLGAFVLLLSAGWRPLRAAFLGLLPATIASRLPHHMTSTNT